MDLDALADAAGALVAQLADLARLQPGQLLVVGCSTSEILGDQIGHASSPEVGTAVARGILDVLRPRNLQLAAQCCEHLNRALIVERAAADPAQIVNAVPLPKAGGSFATAVHQLMADPVVVEEIQADAGLDIGGTLIGMHLRRVAIPVRLAATELGSAHVTAARVRPKYIGGERAGYDDRLR